MPQESSVLSTHQATRVLLHTHFIQHTEAYKGVWGILPKKPDFSFWGFLNVSRRVDNADRFLIIRKDGEWYAGQKDVYDKSRILSGLG
jgi:hypothetical protein